MKRQKVLTFVVNKNKKLLALLGSNDDPQFHESFWYVVTGSVEDIDLSLEDAVKREVFEETGLETEKIINLNTTYEYISLGDECVERCFITYVLDGKVNLNEESIDYKWCSLDEFISLVRWYFNKDELKNMLQKALTKNYMIN